MRRIGPQNREKLTRTLVRVHIVLACCALGLAVVLAATFAVLSSAYPAKPLLAKIDDYSIEVVDRHGDHLRIFTNRGDRWRLKTDLDQVDPNFQRLLVAYEDQRFFSHHGVDPLALMRAAGQFASSGRVISGGSTITMQLARLLEPRKQRSLGAKFWQIFRALQLETQLTKREILQHYLTLAPYGGNIEGVRAAALSWFGKEPSRLALREAALLVALPQAPERRRPDRFADRAQKAVKRVLARLANDGLVDQAEVERVAALPFKVQRRSIPMLAPHLAQAAVDRDPQALRHQSTLDAKLQRRMETLAQQSARRVSNRASVAIVVADSLSGEILASVGSPGINDQARRGWIDMTRAPRSPGSTLKPFVYGLAIEDGLVRPASMIADRPADFDGYRPTNFDMTFQGDVSVRRALQMSLNVPAVKLMDAVGPSRLIARFNRTGVAPRFAQGGAAGLGLVLGGTSMTLTELVQLYANLVSVHPKPLALGDGIRSKAGGLAGRRLMSRVASWHVIDMLAGVPQPVGSSQLPIAYKTGTSYGYRDAWSIGFDGRHVIGVWVGRADNGPVPGITGIKTAAPILFSAFEASGLESTGFAPAPPGAIREDLADLPAALKTFEEKSHRMLFSSVATEDILAVAFPAHGDELEVSQFADGSAAPIMIKLQGGVPPFRLLENQQPVAQIFRQRRLMWSPKSRGTATLSVIDAIGQSQALDVRIR
ncbi:MAG: penicillin-binding protein 1C [Rhizobiaceae bacterium]|nr:penicillin-binding protein 1C [Hyphomicrobiales bacterium]NRB32400.1 penicillin-binding protein 1C [Rhizobiaceae bacterium]